MALNKPKISSLLQSQFPEFVREDYQTFVSFLQVYYEYLEQNDIVDFKSLRDVDNTLDSFIKYFKDEFSKNFPNTLVDDRFLLQHIKDFYLAKGSEASYKFLFKILFNKNVEINYPSKQMLRASDGRWSQDVSVFAKVNFGTPSMVNGKIVDVVTSTKTIQLQIDKTQTVDIEIDNVKQVSPDIYEFYINRRFFGKISGGDRIKFSTIFDATILATTPSIKIVKPGKKFKVGQLFTIKNTSGSYSVLKITNVDSNGSILSLQFVKYGIGYETDFSTTLLPSAGNSSTLAGAGGLSIYGSSPNYGITFNETINGFFEQGYVNRQDYNVEGVWDGTYNGDIVREFFADNKYSILDPEEPALISITLGAVAKYPGYYLTNDGFLDDAIYIQDSRYYQAFSYVLKIDEQLESYKSIVKTLIHPTGMALFGEFDIRNEFDLSTGIESMLNYSVLTSEDQVLMRQTGFTMGIGKSLEDSTSTQDSSFFSFNKKLDPDNVSLNDNITGKIVGKVLDLDSVSLNDSSSVGLLKTSLDSISLVDSDNKGLNKSLIDSFNLSENASVITAKYIDDAATLSDSGGLLWQNPYDNPYPVESSYFSNEGGDYTLGKSAL
jgi:hypothetical protein